MLQTQDVVRLRGFAEEWKRLPGFVPRVRRYAVACFAHRTASEAWSGRRESNPCYQLGRLELYH